MNITQVDTSKVTNEQAPGFVRDQLNSIPIEKLKTVIVVAVTDDDAEHESIHIGIAGASQSVTRAMSQLNMYMVRDILERLKPTPETSEETVPEGTTKH